MSVFADYAHYYDLLYRDKDYAGEVDHVASLLQKYAPAATSLLELGCGTGHHAELLAGKGYRVHGIDRSDDMLQDASRRLEKLPEPLRSNLSFSAGDVRDLSLGRQFDAVISLFHVMSYMTGNDDLARAFSVAGNHLVPGGLFLFDCWYGPAVLADPPVVRVKRLEDERCAVTRIAEPVLRENDNVVEVHYDLHILDKTTDKVTRLEECHPMRYLFLPEIRELFARTGMELVYAGEWLTGEAPGTGTWNICLAGRVPL